MKFALAQMEVVPGRPKKNLETMLRMIEHAKTQKVDLIAFPELCLSGYLLGDKFTDPDFCANLMEFNDIIRAQSQGIAIAYGNIYQDDQINQRVTVDNTTITHHHPNKDGRSRKYNAIYVFQNGKPVERVQETNILPPGVQPKTLLPTYRFFDDQRYFFSLQDQAIDFGVPLKTLAQPFLIEVNDNNNDNAKKKIPIGFEVCEDLWCADYKKDFKNINITKMLVANGAQYIINISASPWTVGKNVTRDRRVKALKEDIGDSFVPFLYVNCVGAQNNGKNIVTFDGGTTIYNNTAEPIVLSTEHYKEELITIKDTDFSNFPLNRIEKPTIAQKLDALIRGIRHIKDMTGNTQQPKYVVGMSGGIDSALVASLLTLAIGPDKVMGINMPTIYNQEKTKKSAEHTAQKLGIAYQVIPISDLVNNNTTLLNQYDLDGSGKALSSLNTENIQAKIRSINLLSNIAAKYNAIYTNNGNKVETFFGYATLDGDARGGIAPLADLTKAEIFELATYLNNDIFHDEVIPQSLIPDKLFRFGKDQIAPSAELKEAQIDPMKFGYHCAMIEAALDYNKKTPEQFMRWYIEGTLHTHLNIPTALMHRWGVDDPKEFVSDLDNFAQSLAKSTFKRVQAPPIIITSKTSFGYDLRESILPWEPSLEYDRLKEKIISTMTKYQPQNQQSEEVSA